MNQSARFSPVRLLMITIIAVFAAEALVMAILFGVFESALSWQSQILAAFFDALVLTLIVFPVLYWFSFKPLVRHNQQTQAAERALLEERQRLFSLLDELPAPVHLKGADYRLRFTNRLFRQAYGDPEGKYCYQLTRQADAPCTDCPLEQVIQHRKAVEWEWSSAPGQRYMAYSYPFVDVDGQPLMLQLDFDITDRKNAEQLALQQAARSVILERASQALADANLVFPAVLEAVVRQIAEAIGDMCILRLISEDGSQLQPAAYHHRDPSRAAYAREVYSTLEGAHNPDLGMEVLHSGRSLLIPNASPEELKALIAPQLWEFIGEQSSYSMLIVPLRLRGRIIGTISITRDQPAAPYTAADQEVVKSIAERAAMAIENARLFSTAQKALEIEQRMRSQLVQSEKLAAMGQMVASVAHELNNPLQTIKNCLFLTSQETLPSSPSQEYLHIASLEVQRLSDLVLQLRDVYRPGANLQMRIVDIHQLLGEVRILVAPHLKNNNVTWEQPASGVEALIRGIPDQLKQVFINLSVNAAEAMQPAGGSLRIAAARSEEEVIVEFSDTGPGIEPDHLPKLFDPFFSTKERGTGLGLAVSYDIIQRHGGQISVESEPGKGARFIVRLPIAAGEEEEDVFDHKHSDH
ncbi:MAG: ATP-binding protein [Chloroflexi bacterium]|nr:ATP-binding protein [Chloroflexota bacterium]